MTRCVCVTTQNGTRHIVPAYCPSHGDPGGVTVIWTTTTDPRTGRAYREWDGRIEERWQP